ncbi:choline-phosphate cytidylyltransferase B-like isoform X1 [Littorina saxatilis]|uniref:choline-phosphate cytidylyltransferase B-like isoform X1 n=2 Tax=Littorina saxatilis TaxID=31220 RepID=UPI0038B573AD
MATARKASAFRRRGLRSVGMATMATMATNSEMEVGMEKVTVSRKRTHDGRCKNACPQLEVNLGPAPFHTEPLALRSLEQCDYSIRISLDEARKGLAPRPVRVYADGIYDMFHTGHARQLMQAKMAFPNAFLIVGVCSDRMTNEKKGRTVMNEFERYEAIRHCRYVDEVVTDAPWTLDMDFLTAHKIDFVAHDDLPYTTGSADDVYKFVKERGMFLPTERTEGISTTDVITRIIKDYDVYIRRNLARGYSHKELNVSYMKAKRLKIRENYAKFEEKIKDKGKELMSAWKESKDRGNLLLHKWEEKSKEFIGNFVDMFGKEGKINKWISENRMRIGRAISPPGSPSHDWPPSPSSDLAGSPPRKRGRYSPGFSGEDFTDDDDDEEEEEVEGEEEEGEEEEEVEPYADV